MICNFGVFSFICLSFIVIYFDCVCLIYIWVSNIYKIGEISMGVIIKYECDLNKNQMYVDLLLWL